MLTLFVIISFLGVVVIVRQIIGNQKHLTEETIRKFLINQLNEKEHNQMTAHLGICEACQDRLHNFGKNDKPIEDHLIDKKE